MSEKKLIIDQLKTSYEGIFDLTGLYRMIDQFFYDKGFDKRERLNTEQIMPSGRMIKIEILPFKNVTDYFKIIVKIRFYGTNIKRVEIERDGAKIPLSEGKIMIIIDGYVESDRFSRWEQTPFLWFLRTIFDKYVFKGYYLRAEQWLLSDVEDIQSRIKSFLNVYRGKSRDTITAHVIG
jgi:hypothetical protein